MVNPRDRHPEPVLQYQPRLSEPAGRSRAAYAALAAAGVVCGSAYAFFGMIGVFVWQSSGGTPALHRAATVFALAAVAAVAVAAGLGRGRRVGPFVAGLGTSLAAGVSAALYLLYSH